MALKEALQRGSIQSSPYQKQENVKNSDQLHMFSENQKAYFVVKRSLDIVLSFLLLAILSPIFIICALAIKLESSGSIIFRQERVGRGGEPFRVYKFRTMYKHTPNNVATNQFKNPDHYITKVGKILRVTSLDELPQLLNVLKGEMSLVGPRPLILAEEKIHSQRLKRGVYSLRPGVTGYAQVNGRDLVDEESKVNLDTEYLMHISFFLDLKILLKTVAVVFSRKDYQEGCVENADAVTANKPEDANAA